MLPLLYVNIVFQKSNAKFFCVHQYAISSDLFHSHNDLHLLPYCLKTLKWVTQLSSFLQTAGVSALGQAKGPSSPMCLTRAISRRLGKNKRATVQWYFSELHSNLLVGFLPVDMPCFCLPALLRFFPMNFSRCLLNPYRFLAVPVSPSEKNFSP